MPTVNECVCPVPPSSRMYVMPSGGGSPSGKSTTSRWQWSPLSVFVMHRRPAPASLAPASAGWSSKHASDSGGSSELETFDEVSEVWVVDEPSPEVDGCSVDVSLDDVEVDELDVDSSVVDNPAVVDCVPDSDATDADVSEGDVDNSADASPPEFDEAPVAPVVDGKSEALVVLVAEVEALVSAAPSPTPLSQPVSVATAVAAVEARKVLRSSMALGTVMSRGGWYWFTRRWL